MIIALARHAEGFAVANARFGMKTEVVRDA
jgi:hypothetical protein